MCFLRWERACNGTSQTFTYKDPFSPSLSSAWLSSKRIIVGQPFVDRTPHAKSAEARRSRARRSQARVPTPFSCSPRVRGGGPGLVCRVRPRPPSPRGARAKPPLTRLPSRPVPSQVDHPRHGARAAGAQRGPACHRPVPALAQRGQAAAAGRPAAAAERKVSGAAVPCRTPLPRTTDAVALTVDVKIRR